MDDAALVAVLDAHPSRSLADALGVSASTISDWRKARRLPTRRAVRDRVLPQLRELAAGKSPSKPARKRAARKAAAKREPAKPGNGTITDAMQARADRELEQTRLTRARADMVEHDLRLKRGEVVLASAMHAALLAAAKGVADVDEQLLRDWSDKWQERVDAAWLGEMVADLQAAQGQRADRMAAAIEEVLGDGA